MHHAARRTSRRAITRPGRRAEARWASRARAYWLTAHAMAMRRSCPSRMPQRARSSHRAPSFVHRRRCACQPARAQRGTSRQRMCICVYIHERMCYARDGRWDENRGRTVSSSRWTYGETTSAMVRLGAETSARGTQLNSYSTRAGCLCKASAPRLAPSARATRSDVERLQPRLRIRPIVSHMVPRSWRIMP
jgi:hypothetical protein